MKKRLPMIHIGLLGMVCVSSLQALTFSTWQASHFTLAEQSNAAISGDTADPDHDGLPNLMEYALGRDPKVVESAANPIMTVVKGGGGVSIITFQRPQGITDVDYVVEASADMQTWADGYGGAWTTQIIAGTSFETVTSQSLLAASSRQFMRLKVIRSPRAAILSSITTTNSATNNDPVNLLDLCTVKSGAYAGGIVRYPMRPGPNNGYEDPNYELHWYHANIMLYYFVETEQAKVESYMTLYLKQVDANYRIRDVDLLTADFSVWQNYHPDSDDAYAGSFLQLVGKHRRTYGDAWFRANKAALKNIAYYNIATQIKVNGLTQTFQGGVSSDSDIREDDPVTHAKHAFNSTGYLMDNIQAWAGLKELVDGLQADPNEPQSEVNYYAAFRDSMAAAIQSQLWDSVNNCWKPADVALAYTFNNVTYAFPPFYPFVQCQYFPELYGLPYGSDPAETQRRYNLGWSWLEANIRTDAGVLTPWQNSAAWWTEDVFSHIDIAVVAVKRGEWQKVNSFLQMAAPRWLPGSTTHTATPCDQIGYWHWLTSP